MAEELKIEEVMSAVKELRETFEKKGADSTEYKEKQEKIEKDLEEYDKKNQELVLAQEQSKKESEEVVERMKALELEVAKGAPGPTGSYKDMPEYKAVEKFYKLGEKGMLPEEIKTLRTDVDTGAGYLTGPPEFDNAIIKSITEISPMRQVARVRTTSKKQLQLPKRTAIPTATYEGEAQAGSESQSTYALETLNAFRLTVTVPYTLDMLMDSEFSLESEIMNDVNEAFAQTEGNKFILGTGVKQPEGFLVNTDIITVSATGALETAGSGVVVPNDIINLSGRLKIGYNPVYTLNRTTLATVRTMVDTNGGYIWHFGIPNSTGQAGSVPSTIAGERYVLMQDMPSIASGNFPIAFGDFQRGYTIIDRTGTMIIRDETTGKKSAIIEMTFHRYNGGQVVLAEAIKVLKVAA